MRWSLGESISSLWKLHSHVWVEIPSNNLEKMTWDPSLASLGRWKAAVPLVQAWPIRVSLKCICTHALTCTDISPQYLCTVYLTKKKKKRFSMVCRTHTHKDIFSQSYYPNLTNTYPTHPQIYSTQTHPLPYTAQMSGRSHMHQKAAQSHASQHIAYPHTLCVHPAVLLASSQGALALTEAQPHTPVRADVCGSF